jgi:hypothetical protein
MHGYGQFCPVAVACEVFAERWTPLIALRSRDIRLDGPRDLVRAFPGWLLLSHYAGVARPRPARAS